MEALEFLEQMIEEMGEQHLISAAEKQRLVALVTEYGYFLKAEYYSLLSYTTNCAVTNVLWALSDKSATFRSDNLLDKESYNQRCPKFDIFEQVHSEIYTIIDDVRNNPDQYSPTQINKALAFEYTLPGIQFALSEWVNHQVRSKHSNFVRREIVEELQNGEAFMIMDFAQKFLPRMWNEKQSDYFGKIGISWHVSYVIAKHNDNLHMHTFVHILGTVDQTGALVNSIIGDIAEAVQQNGVHTLTIRTDGASYYKNAALLYSLPKISEKTGVNIKRYSFSEAQAGKAAADAETSKFKAIIHAYLNSKNNVNSPKEMYEALHSSLRAKGFSVILTEQTPAPLRKIVLPNIRSYSDFEFSKTQDSWVVTMHKHYGIGRGEQVVLADEDIQDPKQLFHSKSHTRGGDMGIWKTKVTIDELAVQKKGTGTQTTVPTQATIMEHHLFYCDDENCDAEFFSYRRYREHMDADKHNYRRERKTMEQQAVEQYTTAILGFRDFQEKVVNEALTDEDATLDLDEIKPMGWAIRQYPARIKKSAQVIAFLEEQRQLAKQNKQKRMDAHEISKLMRTASNIDGSPKFNSEERLSTSSIKSYYSAPYKQTKSTARKNIDRQNEEENVEEDDFEYDLGPEEESQQDVYHETIPGGVIPD